MGRRLIEVMEVLVDQVHKAGYQHRVLEDSIYEEKQKRVAAEKDRDHWKQARDTAIEGGELLLKSNQTLQAEVERLRAFVDIARLHITPTITYSDVALVQSALAELDAGTETSPVAEPLDAEGGA